MIICCYTADRWQLLGAAVDAAAAQLRDGDRVLVIVDHNEDLRTRLVERYSAAGTHVSVEPNQHERGLSGARNTGLALAAESAVVFLDDDAVLRAGSLDAVRGAFTDPTVVGVGGAVAPVWPDNRAPAWFPDEFGWVVGCDYRGIAADGADLRNPIGAAMAVRRLELDKIGGFSSRLGRVGTLPVGCEETLMGIELHRAFPAATIRRVTGFAVDHSVSDDRVRPRYFLSRCFHEGQSKAVLSGLSDTQSALSTEVNFVLRTLSSGVLRYTGQVMTGRISAVSRIVMMLLGLFVTAFGTLLGSFAGRRSHTDSTPAALEKATAGGTSTVRGTPARRRRTSPVEYGELVSLVIPTVGRDLLADSVTAALAQDYPNIEIVIVDNRPESGRARQVLADAGLICDRVRVVDEAFAGISAARNTGMCAAAGRVVVFTDDDATPRTDWVSKIVDTFVADKSGTVGAVCGRVVGVESPTHFQEMFEEAKIFDRGEQGVVWAMDPLPEHVASGVAGEHNEFFPYTAGKLGSGNNMAFVAETVADIGGFDERLGTGMPARGGEDLDLLRTVILTGWAIEYRPDAIITHYHRDNIADLREQSFGYGTGMTAGLTKLMVSGYAGAVLRRVPAGLHMLLAPSSEHNTAFAQDWPLQLRLLEKFGYFVGPLLFLRGHMRCRAAGRPTTREIRPV